MTATLNRAERRAAAHAARKPGAARRAPPAAHALLNTPGLLLAYGEPDHSPTEVARLITPKRLAFERIRSGHAVETPHGQPGPSDSNELAEMVNMLVLLSERVTDPETRAHIQATGQAAQAAVLSAQTREQSMGRFGFDGPGLHTITEALDLYEQLLGLTKPAHLAQAQATMIKRRAEGNILKAAP